MISSSFENVMEKIRVHLESKFDSKVYDVDIAASLGITKEHYSRIKKQNKVPLQSIIEFCAKENLVINYILFDQIPESLHQSTDKIITIKYFKHINSSAGGGATNEKEEYVNLQIDQDVADQLGGLENLKHIQALNVIGESMEPIIKDQSLIFIDRSKTSLCSEKENIYVINTPAGVFVKKVKFIPTYNKIQLISTNKLYSPELFDIEDVTIIGKVVGTSNDEYIKAAA